MEATNSILYLLNLFQEGIFFLSDHLVTIPVKPKANRRKEITETNENRKTTEKINKTKSFF